jgi:hypothetical protein
VYEEATYAAPDVQAANIKAVFENPCPISGDVNTGFRISSHQAIDAPQIFGAASRYRHVEPTTTGLT